MAVAGLTPDCPSTSYVSWKNVTGGVVKKKKLNQDGARLPRFKSVDRIL